MTTQRIWRRSGPCYFAAAVLGSYTLHKAAYLVLSADQQCLARPLVMHQLARPLSITTLPLGLAVPGRTVCACSVGLCLLGRAIDP